MSDRNLERLGALIQAYTRARWGGRPDQQAVESAGARLDPGLRDRIDVLGMDGERLLTVAPADVLAELQVLEREAALEDAGAEAAAGRARTQEGRHTHDRAKGARSRRRMRPGGHREPAGHGRRRQRR